MAVDNSSSTLHAYQRVGDTWREVFTRRADEMTVDVADDHATIGWCDKDSPDPCLDVPGKRQTIDLRWDGTSLSHTP
jgi:hypothetical protein